MRVAKHLERGSHDHAGAAQLAGQFQHGTRAVDVDAPQAGIVLGPSAPPYPGGGVEDQLDAAHAGAQGVAARDVAG